MIVLVCTPAYCERFDRRVGAVGYAAELIAGRLIASSASRPSVVPVLRSGDERSIPSIFKGREIVRMTGKEVSLLEYEALLDTVLGLSRSNNRGPEVRQSPFRISHRRDAISAENIQGLVEAANRYPPPRQPDQNARLADGRWVLRSEVGRGGIARVWRSWDDTLRADVAIKMLLSQSAQDRSRVARFFRGARVMKELEGANVVGVIDQGRIENGLGYYVMEFLPGGSLGDRLRSEPFDLQATLRIASEIGSALTELHQRGRVHRDVKPDNIMLDASGNARLGDFDLVREPGQTRYTERGRAMGTARYGAPEALVYRSKNTDRNLARADTVRREPTPA